jgi:hypothetical protein
MLNHDPGNSQTVSLNDCHSISSYYFIHNHPNMIQNKSFKLVNREVCMVYTNISIRSSVHTSYLTAHTLI